MIIKALKTFSDGVISMHEGEIANIPDAKANVFIAEGYAVEYTGEGGSVDLSDYAKLTDLENIDEVVINSRNDEIHTLLTETTPIETYGNVCRNEYVWIPNGVFIPRGGKGKLKILSQGIGRSYKLFFLKKNSNSNFSITNTYEHTVDKAVSIDEYTIEATTHDVYLGFYTNDGALVYTYEPNLVNNNDTLVRNTLASFSGGTSDVTEATQKLNFAYSLTIDIKTPKGNIFFPCVVDANGNGDFTSINDAINATSDGDVIYIKNGTYNEKVNMWGKNRHLLGETKENTLIISGAREYNAEPLKANIGIIENLTIIGGYGLEAQDNYEHSTSYGIHIEYSNSQPYELLIQNCNIISNVASAIGMGVRYNQKVIIKNCYIETKASQMWSSVNLAFFDCGAIFAHNDASGANLGTDGYLSVENCELKGVKTALTLQSQNNGNTLTFRFLKNTLWSVNKGKTDAITLNTEATAEHLVGSDGVLDPISFGNNISMLNA